MFGKLIKHEFKATGRVVPIVYLATAMMAVVTYGTSQLGIRWLFSISMVVLVLLGVIEVILTYVLVISRYYRDLYGPEGYLTQTLPVRPAERLFSKLLVAFVWFTLSYLVAAGVVIGILASAAHEQGTTLGMQVESIRQAFQLSQTTLTAIFCGFAAYLMLASLYQLAQFFFAITFGNIARFHKLGIAGPIIVYLAEYVLLQVLGILFMVIIPFGVQMQLGPDNQITALRLVNQGMWQSLLHPDSPEIIIGFGSIVLSIIATTTLLLATARLLARHTSLR